MSAVPLVGDRAERFLGLVAAPDLAQHDHWMPLVGCAADFLQRESALQLCLQALLARDTYHFLGPRSFLGGCPKELHQLLFIDRLAPIAHHTLQSACAAGVLRALARLAE